MFSRTGNIAGIFWVQLKVEEASAKIPRFVILRSEASPLSSGLPRASSTFNCTRIFYGISPGNMQHVMIFALWFGNRKMAQ
jgi:hypothetical protein